MLNKKIKNATQSQVDNIKFKSVLEGLIYRTFKDAGFDIKYEPIKFVIWKGFYPTVPFYDKDSKTGLIKLAKKKLMNITYTPDFCFNYNRMLVIVEAKGYPNDCFALKKKLFRGYLEQLEQPVIYFELYSKKQALEAIKIIKEYDNNTENKGESETSS